jgi:hypothetical protein
MTDTTTNERIVALEKNLNAARMDIANLNTLVDKLTHVDENNLGVVDRILARLDGLEADKRLDKIDQGHGDLRSPGPWNLSPTGSGACCHEVPSMC